MKEKERKNAKHLNDICCLLHCCLGPLGSRLAKGPRE